MRKAEREITGFEEIVELIGRCDTIRIGIADRDAPYVVPVSFGYEAADGAVTVYFHGASAGRKYDLLSGRPRVCVEGDICHGFADNGHGGFTCEYESFIGWGRAERVVDDEAEKGLRLLLEHCGCPVVSCGPEVMKITAVFRIRLDTLTGKRRNPKHP